MSTENQAPESGEEKPAPAQVTPNYAPPVAAEPAATDTAPASEESKSAEHIIRDYTPVPTVNMEASPFRPLKKEEENAESAVYMLRESADEMKKILAIYPRSDFEKTAEGRLWTQSIRDAAYFMNQGTDYLRRIMESGSSFGQSVQAGGVALRAGKPDFGSSKDPSQRLTGEKAILALRGSLGLGSMIQIPLYHSGIWLSIKPPSNGDLAVLDMAIANEKVAVGMTTNGLVFSNVSVYLYNLLLNFILDHVYTSTVYDSSKEKLRDLILAPDIPVMIGAMACTIYPGGFNYRAPCIADPNKCRHIEETMINLSKIFWTDENALTVNQKKHMIDRSAHHTEEVIRNYQKESVRNATRNIDLNDRTRVVLRVPTINQYLTSGFKWISDITKVIHDSVGSKLPEKEINAHIRDQATLTLIRQYGSWVERIVLLDPNKVNDSEIDDTETVDELMDVMSGDDQLADKFFEEMTKYIEDCTITLMAVPRMSCPVCKEPMSEEYRRHPNLNPIEVAKIFFTLTDQRLSRIRAAESPA